MSSDSDVNRILAVDDHRLIRRGIADPFRAPVDLLGVLLLVGLWTPIAGALVAVIAVWKMVSQPAARPQCVWIAVIASALALLGPGAWSVDAWLYGWKQEVYRLSWPRATI